MLENRIPPPIVTLTLALAMYPMGRDGTGSSLRVAVAIVLLSVAAVFLLPAVRSFRMAGTTVNPVRIDRASTLVTRGVYRVTRNPMYLGMVLALSAWAAWLGGVTVWLGPMALFLWLDRLQIRPEERAMATLFGAEYDAYRSRVRRWL